MFCVNCGKQISDNAGFCTYCGAKQPEATVDVQGAPGQSAQGMPGQSAQGAPGSYVNQAPVQDKGPLPDYSFSNEWPLHPQGYTGQLHMVGFSQRISSPEFKEALKKSKRAGFGCSAICIPLPFIVYMIAYFASDEVTLKDALVIGGGISLLLLVIVLIVNIVKTAKTSWDGTVVSKEQKTIKRRVRNHDPYVNRKWKTEEMECDIVHIQKDSGKMHTIQEERPGKTYCYFNVGDRVRFHAGTGMSYQFEKYDKSRDIYTICLFCGHKTKISEDKCKNCHNPILK